MTKRLEEMLMSEVEDLLGPGTLVPEGDVWLSRRWQCGRCEAVYETAEPVEMPVPCRCCGGIVFLRLRDVTH